MKKHLLFLLFVLPYAFFANAQEASYNIEDPTVVSPQVASMIRYDMANVALNTGRVDLTIPLISFEDPDFDINLSLDYCTDGFKPMSPDNFVGMHWMLNAGGVIMRQINGLPDDALNIYCEFGLLKGNHPRFVNGFLKAPSRGDLKNSLLGTSDPADLLDTGYYDEGTKKISVISGTSVEASSDVYRFRFGKHSGMFMIDLDKSVKVVSSTGAEYKVDLSGYISRPYDNNNYESVIKIITDDGYTYCFGGHYDAMEYCALSWGDLYDTIFKTIKFRDSIEIVGVGEYESLKSSLRYRRNEIVAYHLTKIIAPNGRTLTILYDNSLTDEYHLHPEYLLFGNFTNMLARGYNKCYSVSVNLDHSETSSAPLPSSLIGCKRYYNINKLALIRHIITDDKNVSFDYSGTGNSFFPRISNTEQEFYEFLSECGAQLNSVTLTTPSGEEKATLAYMNKSQTGGRLILSEVRNTKYGRYSFSYDNPYSLPSLTMDVDQWGYWSGLGANEYIIPQVDFTYNNVDLDRMVFHRNENDTNREPTGKDYTRSLLTKVTVPTGGTIEYDYEPHTYSEYLRVSRDNEYIPILETASDRKSIAGGARVKRTTIRNGKSGNPVIKAYKYVDTDAAGEFSSGTLMYEGPESLDAYIWYLRDFAENLTGLYDPIEGSPTIGVENFLYIRDDGLAFYYYPITRLKRPSKAAEYISYNRVVQYDAANIVSKPDSLYSLSVIDLESKVIKQIGAYVGRYGDVENCSEWRIRGDKAPNRSSSVSIKRGNDVVFYYSFEGGETITLKPMLQFGSGYYVITLETDAGLLMKFEADYPGTGYELIEGPYKVTRFYSYKDFPDTYNSKAFLDDRMMLNFVTDFFEFNHTYKSLYATVNNGFNTNYYMLPADHSPQRGKVKSEEWYSSKGTILKSTDHTYYTLNQGSGLYIHGYPHLASSWVGHYSQVAAVPLISVLPWQTTTKEYDQAGNFITTTREIRYNSAGKTVAVIENTPQWETGTFYTYAKDIDREPYIAMAAMNNNPVVEQTATIRLNSDQEEFTAHRHIYNYELRPNTNNDNLPVVSSIEYAAGNKAPETRSECLQYDLYGNPLHIVNDSLTSTVYIWGYTGKCLVAKIMNATPAEVETLLGASLSDMSSLSEPGMVAINALRSQLPDAQVFTYTYLPGIGLSSETTPDGRTSYYEYDASHRLSEIYIRNAQGQKNIIKRYDYNIVNQ